MPGNYTLGMLPNGFLDSAVPRWSHRDPVEGGNPFSPDGFGHEIWLAATTLAQMELVEHDARLATTAEVTLDLVLYRTQLIELAVDRFDTWAKRGRRVVTDEVDRLDYARWLGRYANNWLRYVTETCPTVDMQDELERRLRERCEVWSRPAEASP